MTNPTQLIEHALEALNPVRPADSFSDSRLRLARASLNEARAHLEQPAESAPSMAGERAIPEFFASYEYAPDFSVLVSVYCRRANDVPELVHQESLASQEPIGNVLEIENALSELVDKICPGLDTGSLLDDARTASSKMSVSIDPVMGGRESLEDALAIVESFGPGTAGVNDTFARQILLAEEVKRLRAALLQSPALPVGELTDEQIDALQKKHLVLGINYDTRMAGVGGVHEFARAILAAARAQPVLEPLTNGERLREEIAAAIKVEDDYCVDNGDYMLDSNDCISIVQGIWVRPDFAIDGTHGITQGGKV
jgi:hypothetical protein